MKRSLLYSILLLLIGTNLFGQSSDKAFQAVYKKLNSLRVIELDKSSPDYSKDSTEVSEIGALLDFLNNFLDDEQKLNGSGSFMFSGDESDKDNLFIFGVGASIDNGLYPYELDFSTNIQTLFKDGVFEENVSNVDVSFDFHPFSPTDSANHDGLWLENYIVVKRFNDTYLGIDQRYEAGGGFVFNFFSPKLTKSGVKKLEALNRRPTYNIYGDDLVRCLETCYKSKNILSLSSDETDAISGARERFRRATKKKYSKFRAALLLGIYYEIEKANAENAIFLNGVDTVLTREFDATNRLRWEIRPSIKWQPKDRYILRIYPYFKMPFGQVFDRVREGALVDKRFDYFMDLQTSLRIRVEGNFSIGLNYRLLYDNAPKRKYIPQTDGSFVLLSGQEFHSSYGVSLNFSF